MIGKALYAQLSADAAVAALAATRIFPGYIREQSEQWPQCVYRFTEESKEQCFDGNAGLCYAQVTITCAGQTYASTEALADAVAAALDEQEGTWAGVQVQGVWLEDRTEETIHDASTEQILYFLAELQFHVSFVGT